MSTAQDTLPQINKLEVVDILRDGVPTFAEMEELVERGNDENREFGTTLFRVIEDEDSSWKTLTYSGLDVVELSDGGAVYLVNIQDALEDAPRDSSIVPVTLHSHPVGAGSENASHILPSGQFVENSPEGRFGDLFLIDQARWSGHQLLDPLIIMTDKGITFPIGVINTDSGDYVKVMEMQRKVKPSRAPDEFATVIWSVWEKGAYMSFNKEDKEDQTLADSLSKGYTVSRLTSKDEDNTRREVYFLTASWDTLKKYITDEDIDEEKFWMRVGTSKGGLRSFVKKITNEDLPKEIILSPSLYKFILGF
ncbi:MAG: hypothetical protein ACMG57_00920 [Candidatus Dojkabacteria bacterium]